MTQLTIYQIKALVLISILRPKPTLYDDPLKFAALGYAFPTGQVSEAVKKFHVRFVRKWSQTFGLDA